jgi:hypothetical protein
LARPLNPIAPLLTVVLSAVGTMAVLALGLLLMP